MAIYIVCFNQEDEEFAQLSQILFWLKFLNSAIPQANFPFSSSHSSRKWQVMLVGLRADAKHPSSRIKKQMIGEWQTTFKRIPIYKKEVFSVSALTSEDSVKRFLHKVEGECEQIFQYHFVRIPSTHRDLLRWIDCSPTKQQQEEEEDENDPDISNINNTLFPSTNCMLSTSLLVQVKSQWKWMS